MNRRTFIKRISGFAAALPFFGLLRRPDPDVAAAAIRAGNRCGKSDLYIGYDPGVAGGDRGAFAYFERGPNGTVAFRRTFQITTDGPTCVSVYERGGTCSSRTSGCGGSRR